MEEGVEGWLEGSRFDSKGPDHQSSSALPAFSAVLKGSGWRRADRPSGSAHLLFPPVLAPPPRRDITGPVLIRQVLASARRNLGGVPGK